MSQEHCGRILSLCLYIEEEIDVPFHSPQLRVYDVDAALG